MDEEESDAVFGDIQENLNNMIPVTEDETVEPEPVIVTRSAIADVLAESGVTEEQAAVIENTYENVFGEELPEAGQLVDPKLVEANGKRKEKLELVKQVENLKQQLEETRSVPVSEGDADGEDVPAVKTYDVILRVKPEKVGQIQLPGHRRAEMSGHSRWTKMSTPLSTVSIPPYNTDRCNR